MTRAEFMFVGGPNDGARGEFEIGLERWFVAVFSLPTAAHAPDDPIPEMKIDKIAYEQMEVRDRWGSSWFWVLADAPRLSADELIARRYAP